jgi:L-ascorbate metabolism protein UlaG (beta-lactamase superfamily)
MKSFSGVTADYEKGTYCVVQRWWLYSYKYPFDPQLNKFKHKTFIPSRTQHYYSRGSIPLHRPSRTLSIQIWRMSSPFESKITVTHITTACIILDIDGTNLLTDPVFGPGGSEVYLGDLFRKMPDLGRYGLDAPPDSAFVQSLDGPAVRMDNLPPIDAILLSHEDHVDNLDQEGRKLLEGRMVLTTVEGAHNLHPRPGVHGLRPWETISMNLGGKPFKITGTPCEHFPGGQVTGFILETPSFGCHTNGLPNAIYISGDTVYMPELAQISKKWHIKVAFLNLGAATIPFPTGPLIITMDGQQAARLAQEIGAEIIVPLHFESWNHFAEKGEALSKTLAKGGIAEKVCWLTPGVAKTVISGYVKG